MFGKKNVVDEHAPIKKEVEALTKKLADVEHKNQLHLAEVEANHKLALKEKEFELKHFKDEEVQKLRAELETEKKNGAVLKKENEMLVKITDLNADVIDVKGLVSDLIKKLPEINLTSLTVQSKTK